MERIFVTFAVLKLEIFRLFRLKQLLNIHSMVSTLDVSKPLRSRASSASQQLNIYSILVAFLVSKLLTSISVSFSQPKNMA